MKNNATDINTIVSKIEERGCYSNPGPAARESGEFIDEKFVVIPRSLLPGAAIGGDGVATSQGISEYALGGNTGSMRRHAYAYLALADFLDDREAKAGALKAEKKLKEERFRIFKVLYPETPIQLANFTWETCFPATQNAITRILDLEARLAK